MTYLADVQDATNLVPDLESDLLLEIDTDDDVEQLLEAGALSEDLLRDLQSVFPVIERRANELGITNSGSPQEEPELHIQGVSETSWFRKGGVMCLASCLGWLLGGRLILDASGSTWQSWWEIARFCIFVTLQYMAFGLVYLAYRPGKENSETESGAEVTHRAWARLSWSRGCSQAKMSRMRLTTRTNEVKFQRTVSVEPMEDRGVLDADLSGDCSCACCWSPFEDAQTIAVLPCSHNFCENCIIRWAVSGLQQSSACPLCRASFEG
mmetsp:Transcript_54303/g.126751  ORF Transcript_54303/g.126751 Transcript_54303/m.126751 type:complete len:267 (-) Transcript_54303:302-1102(-)